MSYEVLARKLRPSGFASLVGQDHVVRALTNALEADRLHHAYLFTGTRGVGKTTIARILAKCLNCETGVTATPCGTCSVCTEIKENRFMDLIEVDAASRTGVDDTRDLLENAQYLPTRGRFKIYLIDEVHMLSAASFNALLKTLEEPPEHVKFLLATTDPKKVPVTVLSRCLQFQLKNLSRDAIADYLVSVLDKEGFGHEPEALQIIAKNAAGSMRDALSLTDQAIAYGKGSVLTDDVVAMLGVVGRDEVGAILGALRDGSAAALLEISADLAERNADFVDVLQGLIEALHSQTVAVALGDESGGFSADELQLYYQIALMGFRDIHIVPDERSGFEMTLIRMLSFAPEPSDVPSRKQARLTEPADSNEPTEMSHDARDELKASAPFGDKEVKDQPVKDQPVKDQPVKDQPVKEKEVGAREGDQNEGGKNEGGKNEGGKNQTDENQGDEQDTTSAGRARDRSNKQSQARGQAQDIDEANVRIRADQQEWYAVVEALELSGVSRMIAEHSIVRVLGATTISLLLDEQHDTLLSDPQRQVLARALTDHFGHEVELEIDIGAPSCETPAAYKARMALERQQAAEAAIDDDATVKRLLADFDGRLDAVRPR